MRELRHGLRRLLRPGRLGVLRSTSPVSDTWGFDRGTPVDRYYIEQFLAAHASDIRGRVLEVQSDGYARRFGTGVTSCDVLDIDAGNERATLVADLSRSKGLPGEAFDCFILTQTLHLIYEVREALRSAHHVLRPGGVLLVTVPSVSRISRGATAGGDYWRFTPALCEALLTEVFGPTVTIRSYGNVLGAISFLTGLAQEELSSAELDVVDDRFPVIVGVRAVKSR